MELLIQGSSDDKRGNLELWNEQKRLADDYCQFLEVATERGFKLEIALIVDGQVCRSTAMLNKKYNAGSSLLRELLRAGRWERDKINAVIADLLKLPEKGAGQESP